MIKDKIPRLNKDILNTVNEKKIVLIPAIRAATVENSYNNMVLSFLDNLLKQI